MANSKDPKDRKRKGIGDRLPEAYCGPGFAIRTWDGWSWYSSQSDLPTFMVEFRTPQAWKHLFIDPSEWTRGRAVIEVYIEAEGDLVAAFHLAEYLLKQPVSFRYTLQSSETNLSK